MQKLLETKIPKLIHFSITGLGGTEYEPGVMKPDDLLDRIAEYIKMGLDPNSVTIRIDPIIPGVTTPGMIRNIIKRSSEMGIKRIRFSIMDAYPNTVASMSKLGYDFERNYGINPKTGKPNFTAKREIIDKIVDTMIMLKNEYGVTLGTCAEGLVREGISKEGCLSVESVNRMLGTSIEDKGTANNDQRVLCSCYGGKIDALKYNAACASHCVYCYAKHENDKALEYYNEDGTLKDNVYTRINSENEVIKTVQDNGKIRLSLLSHTDEKPRQIVLEPQGDNKYYVHIRIWDGEKVPGKISDEDKQKLFDALYNELPEGAEILLPKSGEGYYATRGTIAAMQRLARDNRFTPGIKGVVKY
jgi:DNA repair photolyase